MLLFRVVRPFAARAAISGREHLFMPDDTFLVDSAQAGTSALIERPTAESIDAINYVSLNTEFNETRARADSVRPHFLEADFWPGIAVG